MNLEVATARLKNEPGTRSLTRVSPHKEGMDGGREGG